MQDHAQDEVNFLVMWGWRMATVWRGADTECPCNSDPFVQGSRWGSKGIWTGFINPAESDIFKENHPRVCYLYVEYFQSSLCLPYLLITAGWHHHNGWSCRCRLNRLLVLWVRNGEKKEKVYSSRFHWDKYRSDQFVLIRELLLLLVVWGWCF